MTINQIQQLQKQDDPYERCIAWRGTPRRNYKLKCLEMVWVLCEPECRWRRTFHNSADYVQARGADAVVHTSLKALDASNPVAIDNGLEDDWHYGPVSECAVWLAKQLEVTT